jgi:hypothetical protein
MGVSVKALIDPSFDLQQNGQNDIGCIFFDNQKPKRDVMKENQQRTTERNQPDNDSTVIAEEKVLILPKIDAKKNLDQTISSPDRYVSWYQYKIKNLDKYIVLCPHCKKPTLSAFNRSVIDGAIDYLNGKRLFTQYSTSRGNFLPTITLLIAFGTLIYFLLNYF